MSWNFKQLVNVKTIDKVKIVNAINQFIIETLIGEYAGGIRFNYINEMRLHKFEGFCFDDNVASAKMMESLGCCLEGISRECVFMNGKYHNRLLYSLLENEYRQKVNQAK